MSCELTGVYSFQAMESTPRKKRLNEHKIKIEFLNSGAVIKIGCKKIAFTTTAQMMKALSEYVEDPDKATKKWTNKFI